MRTSRIIIVILVVVVIVVAALYAVSVLTATPQLCTPTWDCAAGYPVQVGGTFAIAGGQCFSTNSSIYCIGGQDANGGPRNEVYYASTITSSGNITGWVLDPSVYPRYINGESCVLYSGFVYCVGGMYNDNGDDVDSSYYASVATSGSLGNWTSTTAFPIPVDSQSCVASFSTIYCVGGVNETDGSNADATATNSVWYAPLSTSGIGQWSLTTAYPANVYFPICFISASDIYCLGGADTNGNSLGTAFYATISSSGVGAWTSTSSYPVAGSGQACVVHSGDVVCVGGETGGGSSPTYTNAVYYAPISSGGIGTWKQSTGYPIGIGTTCVPMSTDIYCIGGFDGSSVGENNFVEYASLASLTS
ncbi:MAG TPA: hypothetical protein VLY82_00260 [Nitrososphaerales archaeon]|nr:hypothetical protein [Nitrososphaerales archaeon]